MPEQLRLFSVDDIILAPYCLFVLFVLAFFLRRRYDGTEIRKYYISSLAFRFFLTILYAITIDYYYIGGDTTLFFKALLDMQQAVTDNPAYFSDIYLKAKLDPSEPLTSYFMYDGNGVTHYYMYHVSNFMVPKFALPFSFLFFNSYLCISFCCAFFAFAGCWRLFKMFYTFFPHLKKKLAIAFLYLPSLLFWGSALLKDSICMGALGFFIYAVHQAFFLRRNFIVNGIIIIVSTYLLFYIKPYIILCTVPAFIVWGLFLINKRISDRGVRMLFTLLFAVVSLVASVFLMQRIAQSEIASQYALQNIVKSLDAQQNTYSFSEDAGSYFSVGEFDNSLGGVLLLFPTSVIATFYRPFIWEVRSVVMVFTALEALIFLWLSLLCIRYCSFKRIKAILAENPVLAFCLVFAVLFAGLVGMSTLNFGTLARYKIPALPFLSVFLFVVLDKIGKASPQYILGKRLF